MSTPPTPLPSPPSDQPYSSQPRLEPSAAQDEPVARLLCALAALPILLGGCGDGGPATPLAYGDGVHVVGTQIEPGTYYSPGVTSDALNCTGTVTHAEGSNPVAHSSSVDHTSSRAQTVTITPTDQTFESEGCLPWTKVEVQNGR